MTPSRGTFGIQADVMPVEAEGDVAMEAELAEPAMEPKARTLPVPAPVPAPDIVDRHNLTHLPYQPWCSICRQSRARDEAHRRVVGARREEQEEKHVQVQLDYTFVTEDGATMTILTARALTSGWSAATVVPSKGAVAFAVRWLVTYLQGMGHQAYRLHCDAETSIHALAEAAAKEFGQGTLVVGAPTGSHASIGGVERYHQELHAACRAMKHELERKLHRKLPLTAPLYAWMVRHAGWCLPRFANYGAKTPHEHLYGRPYDGAVVGFGEYVLAREPSATELSKHADRAFAGHWLGRSEAT
eukprot:3796024-Amphidinium_carterae.1